MGNKDTFSTSQVSSVDNNLKDINSVLLAFHLSLCPFKFSLRVLVESIALIICFYSPYLKKCCKWFPFYRRYASHLRNTVFRHVEALLVKLKTLLPEYLLPERLRRDDYCHTLYPLTFTIRKIACVQIR